jgi:glucokinase
LSHVAIDIGATNVRVAVGDYYGIKEKKVENTDTFNGAMGVSAQIIRLIDSFKGDEPISIGIGSIGPINHKEGVITNTPNYPFNDIPITEPLIEKYKVPVTIVNDCTAAVLGEQMFGAGRGIENLVYVTISTGLGGGAIVDDNLLMGKDGNAVEVGHFTLDPESEVVCGCGCRGHWEAFCSGKNIPGYAEQILRRKDWTTGLLHQLCGGDVKNLSAENIFTAAKEGDEYALDIVHEIGAKNVIGFANIVNAFDPELITIGGSIALRNPDLILNPIKENIEKHIINRVPEILITPLGQDSVILGALALAMRI